MSEQTLNERLEALAAFVSVFEAHDFTFGEWDSSPGHLPWFNRSDAASSFVSTASRYGWITPGFDWPTWSQTDRAQQLLNNPEAIASASVEDLEHLLTAHIRADRFIEGHLESAFDNGHLTAIARRAAALLDDGETLSQGMDRLRQ